MAEMILREDKGITYEILQEKDLEETVVLLSNLFSCGEPITKCLEITPKELHYCAELYCKKAVREGLSIIAKDKDTNNVISFLISEDFDSEKPEGIEKIDIKILPGMALLDTLEKDMKSNKKEDEHRFHLFLGGTVEKYQNRNIMTILFEESMKLAKIKHFTSIVAEPSGFATQHMLSKLGFKIRNIVEYKTFLYEGKNVFKNIEGPSSIPLMEKSI